MSFSEKSFNKETKQDDPWQKIEEKHKLTPDDLSREKLEVLVQLKKYLEQQEKTEKSFQKMNAYKREKGEDNQYNLLKAHWKINKEVLAQNQTQLETGEDGFDELDGLTQIVRSFNLGTLNSEHRNLLKSEINGLIAEKRSELSKDINVGDYIRSTPLGIEGKVIKIFKNKGTLKFLGDDNKEHFVSLQSVVPSDADRLLDTIIQETSVHAKKMNKPHHEEKTEEVA